MKKLLTFAGISALALITAAPDAFGAAGTYNPSCSPNEITIKFYGMAKPSSGTTPTLTTLGTAKYKSGKWYKDGGTTAVTTFGALGINTPEISGSISLNDITATAGAKAYRADLYGKELSSPLATQLTGKTVCDDAAPPKSMGVLTSSTLPTLDASQTANRSTLTYVVMYAANCVTGSNATCSLSIREKQAAYTNTCSTGHGANGNNSFHAGVCNDAAISVTLPADPGAPSV